MELAALACAVGLLVLHACHLPNTVHVQFKAVTAPIDR
jgi:hypothetical protein